MPSQLLPITQRGLFFLLTIWARGKTYLHQPTITVKVFTMASTGYGNVAVQNLASATLIFFHVIFSNESNKCFLYHSCQSLSCCRFETDWDWSTQHKRWQCTIRTDHDRCNQEICQKTPWLDHIDPVLYQLQILFIRPPVGSSRLQ